MGDDLLAMLSCPCLCLLPMPGCMRCIMVGLLAALGRGVQHGGQLRAGAAGAADGAPPPGRCTLGLIAEVELGLLAGQPQVRSLRLAAVHVQPAFCARRSSLLAPPGCQGAAAQGGCRAPVECARAGPRRSVRVDGKALDCAMILDGRNYEAALCACCDPLHRLRLHPVAFARASTTVKLGVQTGRGEREARPCGRSP